MFGFLKNKLKEVMGKFSKKIDEEAKTIEVEEEKPLAKPIPKEEPKKVEAKPAPKPEPKPILKPEIKPEVKPKPDTKPESKSSPKSKEEPKKEAPKPEPKPAIKPESKPEPKPIPKTITKEEPKPAPKAEPKPEPTKLETKPEPKPIPKEESKPILKPESKPTPKSDTKPESPKTSHDAAKPEEKKGFLFGLFKKKEEAKEETEEVLPKPTLEKAPVQEPQISVPDSKPSAKPLPTKEEREDIPPPKKIEPMPSPVLEPEPVKEEEEEKPKGLFGRLKEKITKKELSEQQFDEIFWELEVILLENNVAVEVIDKIKADLKESLVGKQLERNKIDDIIQSTLKKTIDELFDVDKIDLIANIKSKKPYVICFVGINGSGKTTTIAKLAHILHDKGFSSVMAAGDTFRAAAIQQLEEHANKLGIKLIKHDYGSDSAAVAFDAISHAKAHNIDVVLIDTAGRLHSNANLMDEIKKVKRVTKPDLVLFIGESITGNDCVEQAKTFDSELGIDGIILSKADVDEKGGAAISISYVTKKPILYLGVGQGYDDLIEFNPQLIVESLGL